MDVSVSARIIANSLNTAGTSREIPQEFRYHATVQDIGLVEISQEVLERFYKPVMNSRRFNWSNCI
jgi:hypothetical protein